MTSTNLKKRFSFGPNDYTAYDFAITIQNDYIICNFRCLCSTLETGCRVVCMDEQFSTALLNQ